MFNAHVLFDILVIIISTGYDKTSRNYAYCPPGAEYRTIDAYVYRGYCPPGPSGKLRKKAPYFSNPRVSFEGFATGSTKANNAEYMSKGRFYFSGKGSNCLDGKPNEEWMTFATSGNIGIGNNCNKNESEFHPLPPKTLSEGIDIRGKT